MSWWPLLEYSHHILFESNSLSREKVVSALSNLMEIDIYGKCGTLKCPKFDIACYINMNQTYKFYLSFENSLCQVEQWKPTLLTNMCPLGLRDWEVFQGPPLQRDTGGVQRSQHVRHSSSSQLYQRWGFQLSRPAGRVSPEGGQKWHFVCFIFLVERLLPDPGE